MEQDSPQKRLEDLRAQLYSWEQLVEQSGWKLVLQYAQAQINMRFNRITRGEEFEISSVLHREYMRGECSGIDLFQRMADIELERLRQEIEVVAKQVELEETENVDIPTPTDPAP